MPVRSLDIEQFMRSKETGVVIDVRTPAEFEQGHIPGAHNLPLFTNEERAEVGTIYKQQGRQPAIQRGLQMVGPKLSQFVDTAQQQFGNNALYIHCWRGGMRSASMAWLLDTAGMVSFTLRGGYKSYRHKVLTDLKRPLPYIVLGGYTGSGKTRILAELKNRGEQIIDLEMLAGHRGSAFGHMGTQPSTEHFANLLHYELSQLDHSRRIWLEDESRSIGRIYLPDDFVSRKRKSPVVFLRIPQEQRAAYLVEEYGYADKQSLAESFHNIKKRLGGDRLQIALEALESNDLFTAARIALQYYDKAYEQSLVANNTGTIQLLEIDQLDFSTIADRLIRLATHLQPVTWKTSA